MPGSGFTELIEKHNRTNNPVTSSVLADIICDRVRRKDYSENIQNQQSFMMKNGWVYGRKTWSK
jgi:hypothetical protein